MAKLIYNKNRFTNVNKWDNVAETYKGILLATKLNQKNGQDYKLLDAIDIDWNRAWFNPTGSYINSTEELFDAIESLDKSEQINAISNQLDEVVDTYVTQQKLQELLFEYQSNIHYGEHLQIDENNVLSTYDLISNQDLYEFSNSYVSHEYFGTYAYTRTEIDEFVTSKIREIIGGANEAFDTIQEISEWIMDQTTFKPIEYSEIDFNNGIRYYVFNEETNKYVIVNEEYITIHPNEQYFIVASIREDLSDIYSQISYINDERIGQVVWDEEREMYTYNGLLKDIYLLQRTDENILNDLSSLRNQMTTASEYAHMAYDTANTAYDTANIAYDTANEAYNIAAHGIGKAVEAYDMAYSAYTQVGHPSYIGYYRLLTQEEKDLLNEGDDVYVYDEEQHRYKDAHYIADNKDYYTFIEPVEGSGLHKALEDVTEVANTALYRLHVDNDYSNGYINLEITPQSYDGDTSRTIHLNTTQCQYSIEDTIVESDGKQYSIQQFNIFNDGMFTAYQINEILAYIFKIDEIKPISNGN